MVEFALPDIRVGNPHAFTEQPLSNQSWKARLNDMDENSGLGASFLCGISSHETQQPTNK